MGAVAQQTPNTQILPPVPTYPDLDSLWGWAQDMTRTLQQNLGNIARKANDTSTYPLTGDLDAQGHSIININNLGNITGTITFHGTANPWVLKAGDTMTGNLLISRVATNSTYIAENTTGGAFALQAKSPHTNFFFDNGGSFWINATTHANVLTQTAGTDLMQFTGTTVNSLVPHYTVASATGGAGFRIPPGTAPSSPVNGDLWETSTDLQSFIGSATVSFAQKENANTFTGTSQTFQANAINTPQINFRSDYNGTNGGYFVFRKTRNSAAVQVGDTLGSMLFQGFDTGLANRTGVLLTATVDAVGSGYADSHLDFQTSQSLGTVAVRMSLKAGLTVGSVTDQGSGTVNAATGFYKNNTVLPIQTVYESAQQTVTSGGTFTLTHGLGVQPKLYKAFAQCVTAEQNYSIGDEVALSDGYPGSSAGQNVSITPTSTTLVCRIGNATNPLAMLNKTTGNGFFATNADWKIVVRAWA